MGLETFQHLLAQRVHDARAALNLAPLDVANISRLITPSPSIEKGDLSFPVFLLMPQGENPAKFAQTLAFKIQKGIEFSRIEAMGPYINVFIQPEMFTKMTLQDAEKVPPVPPAHAPQVMVEYASPNTNKPLHVGHLRNLALAESIIRLFEHQGMRVIRAQVLNDRGVHICKSMLAYQKWGHGKTPESEGMKPDHFVGKFYVEFTQRAEKDPKLEEEAQEMLQRWEKNDPEVRALWKKMNAWAEKGIFETYAKMGVRFDKNYYESEFYHLGKEVVMKAFNEGKLKEADNGAIIIPLEKYKLPDKPAIRGDGTTLYFTQDIYLASKRFQDFPDLDRIVYIVASEQEMHFKQLFATLELIGVPQAKKCYHLGYGLLTLPSGKMSTRAGTVVNADDLISDIEALAIAQYDQRNPELDDKEILRRSRVIALSALKLFLVKQDARKELIFIPEESLSFEGQTGPYLLYTNARIQSILKKSTHTSDISKANLLTEKTEKELVALLAQKNGVIADTLKHYSPHILANYILSLANAFNSYYHEHKIIQENVELEQARLALVHAVHSVLEEGLYLMGIDTLEEM